MTGFQITPSELDQGGSHLKEFGSNMGEHTSHVASTHQSLVAHVGSDQSGLSQVFVKVLGKTGSAFTAEGNQLARVLAGAGTRLQTGAGRTRGTEADIEQSFRSLSGNDGDQPRGEGPTRPASPGDGALPQHESGPHTNMPGPVDTSTHPSGANYYSGREPRGLDEDTGTYFHFNASAVLSRPLFDHHGQVIGVHFPSKAGDETRREGWASAPNRTSDQLYYTVLPQGGLSDPYWAPWSAMSRPIYVGFHSDEHLADVTVIDYTHPSTQRVLAVDGQAMGEILRANGWYHQAAGGDPNRPVVVVGCSSGHPEGTMAGGMANDLHNNGENRSVFAPVGDAGVSRESPNASHWGDSPLYTFDTRDSNGNPIPASFRRYDPSMHPPSAP